MGRQLRTMFVWLLLALAAIMIVAGIGAYRRYQRDIASEIRRSPTALQLKYTQDADPIIASDGNLVDGVIAQGELSEWFQFIGDGGDVTVPLRNEYRIGAKTRIVLSISDRTDDQEMPVADGGVWVHIGDLSACDPYVVYLASFKYWSERRLNANRP